MSAHEVNIYVDVRGAKVASCTCGWSYIGPNPDRDGIVERERDEHLKGAR